MTLLNIVILERHWKRRVSEFSQDFCGSAEMWSLLRVGECLRIGICMLIVSKSLNCGPQGVEN